MRVSREKAAENRARVVAAASRLFREHGIDAVGVDAVMEAAGLTHGGFYKSFASKDALVAEACAHAFPGARITRALESGDDDKLAALVRGFLSAEHRDSRGEGCGFAALAADAARREPATRAVFTRAVRGAAARIASVLPGRSAEARRRRALAVLGGLVGCLILSRAVDDEDLSLEILDAGRATFSRLPRGS